MADELDGVHLSGLLPDRSLPLLFRADDPALDLSAWIRAHRRVVDEKLLEHGALLFRGFPLSSPADFEQVMGAASSGDWVDYREASTPRSHISGHVFTATEYAATGRIYMHNENSHVTSWPQKLFFHCKVPAKSGGETPICDSRRVYEGIPADIRDRFVQKKWQYRRTFGYAVGFAWQKVFNVQTKEALADYCRANYMSHEWVNGDRLHVKYNRWAALKHPATAASTWFNHGLFFNSRMLEPKIRAMLLSKLGADHMPYETFYGDGAPIEDEVIACLYEVYEREKVAFPWQANDVMMIDNMLVAHGRNPYEGERQVFVGMTERVRCEDVAAPSDYRAPGTE